MQQTRPPRPAPQRIINARNTMNRNDNNMTLHVTSRIMQRLGRHAQTAFPQECCGILLGSRFGDAATIISAVPAENIARDDTRRNYQVDWRTLLTTIQSARGTPQDVLGFYHSHPDGSGTPSLKDCAEAWCGHVYVIVPAGSRPRAQATAWRVDDPDVGFQRVSIFIATERC